ncbi:hypothetical protein WJX72_006049 [[Myrmecia] bisecta]|uniref:Uncharacterized protein n=1 Tax=[Myrmecia] bisecta TaxID=41462 RepID=A0AAW1QFH5_9CHLO
MSIDGLPNSKQFVPCREDPSLKPPPSSTGQKYLVAINLRNNEDVMPHFCSSLLETLAILPEGSVFLSIYESGSTDNTVAWLQLLRQLVDHMGVPNRIVTGGWQRAPGQDRIAFLAAMRNAVLAPLYEDEEGRVWEADRIIFLNDVFFCSSDVIRLLQHDGDMVCGMDFTSKQWYNNYPAFQIHPVGKFGPTLGVRQGSTDSHLVFYDAWVARDALGLPFSNTRPYVSHQYSVERIQQGLPFPAKCCWNGLTVLNAAPFRQQNVTFRAHVEGECAASEISLLCEDLLRAGYQRVIVDPAVRQAYTVADARVLYTERLGFIPYIPWSAVEAAPPIDYDFVPRKTYMTCCDKRDDVDTVVWADCHPVDIMEVASRANSSAGLP